MTTLSELYHNGKLEQYNIYIEFEDGTELETTVLADDADSAILMAKSSVWIHTDDMEPMFFDIATEIFGEVVHTIVTKESDSIG